ncbi:hypothetical protein Hanom_Chr16g01448411 [Helianthus anomalus]
MPINSAARVNECQLSGIRATVRRDNNLQSSSTTIACEHCSDEMNERRRKDLTKKRCYYFHDMGHLIAFCKLKEHDKATQLLKDVINTGIQRTRAEYDFFEELIVVGTKHGLWADIWHLSTTFKHHYAGNLNVFKEYETCV